MSYHYSNPYQGYQDRPAPPQRPYEARPNLGKTQFRVFFMGLPEGLLNSDLLSVLKEDLGLPSTTRVFNAYQPDRLYLGIAIVCVDTAEEAERIRQRYDGKVINHLYTLSVHHVLTHDKRYPFALIDKLNRPPEPELITRTPVTLTSNHPFPPQTVGQHQGGVYANGYAYPSQPPPPQPKAQISRGSHSSLPPKRYTNGFTSQTPQAGPSRTRGQAHNAGGRGQKQQDPMPGLSLLKRISKGPAMSKNSQQLQLLEKQKQNLARSQPRPQPHSSQPRRAHQTRAQRTMASLRAPQQSSRAKVQ
ncbi:hypothetical protein IAR50_002389 [Cryptococcus sp. DSM 104548]